MREHDQKLAEGKDEVCVELGSTTAWLITFHGTSHTFQLPHLLVFPV